jgi:hypothetical protein
MSPERRFGVTLLASLALWYPTLQELLASNVSLATALVRYAIGLGVAWLAVAGVDRLLSGYRDANLTRTRVARLRRISDIRAEAAPPEIEAPDSDASAA